jgi:phosphopantetheinyl transferase
MIIYQNVAAFDHTKYMHLLTENEKIRALQFVKENDRKLGVSAILIVRMLTKTRQEILRNGKPYIKGLIGNFNISHHNNYAIGIFSKFSPVGIDVTVIDTDIAQSLDAFTSSFTANEWNYINQDIPTRFAVIWALKEAYLKSTGEGLSIDLSRLEFIISKVPTCESQSRIYLEEFCSITFRRDGLLMSDYYFEIYKLDAEHLVAVAIKNLNPKEFSIPVYKTAQVLKEKDLTIISSLPLD